MSIIPKCHGLELYKFKKGNRRNACRLCEGGIQASKGILVLERQPLDKKLSVAFSKILKVCN